MKKYIRSSFGYYDEDWINPPDREWEEGSDCIIVDLPAFTIHTDADGDLRDDSDELYMACLNATIDNDTMIYDAEIREEIYERLPAYIGDEVQGLKSQTMEVSGRVLIEIVYPVYTLPPYRGEIDWENVQIESFDFSEVVITPVKE